MKKSSIIKLVLVSTVAASCSQQKENNEWSSDTNKKKVYMRSDTSASYSRSHYRHGLSYFVFRPFGTYFAGSGYRRMGYYSDAIHQSSNVGRSAAKSSYMRGGFGGSASRVSS